MGTSVSPCYAAAGGGAKETLSSGSHSTFSGTASRSLRAYKEKVSVYEAGAYTRPLFSST
jgi:hypothetical protein